MISRRASVINSVRAPRSAAAITLSVWQALMLREALSRLFSSRAAWFWLLAEPVMHVAYLIFIYTAIRLRTIGGIDTAVWVIAGMLAFFMFRRTMMQVTNAVSANTALFTYRQVKPIDAVLVRGVIEGTLMLTITVLLLAGAALFGHSVIPDDPLMVATAFLGLWLLGLGMGLIISVLIELVPEAGRLISLAMRPLYILSGVILPISAVPQPYRDWLLWNPVVHGLEAARLGFSPYYHAVPEMNISYLYGFSLVAIFLGLAMHRRAASRLVTR